MDCVNFDCSIFVKKKNKDPIQPVSGTIVPRFAGPSTFARLPELRDVESCDVAIVGIPFDAGTSYRPGARFGPQSIRQLRDIYELITTQITMLSHLKFSKLQTQET